jgi:hypothetical protein
VEKDKCYPMSLINFVPGIRFMEYKTVTRSTILCVNMAPWGIERILSYYPKHKGFENIVPQLKSTPQYIEITSQLPYEHDSLQLAIVNIYNFIIKFFYQL